jgi:uncharacterized membrane protein
LNHDHAKSDINICCQNNDHQKEVEALIKRKKDQQLHIQNAYLDDVQKTLNEYDESPDHLKLSPFFLFWALVIFSFLGYIVEMLFEIVMLGTFESRQGLIYGPFSQIYGIGAVIGIVASRKYHHKHLIFIFMFCAVLGSVYEFCSSLFLEVVFGASAWNYNQSLLNIQGRTSPQFAIYWALIGTLIIKFLYPALCRFLRKIPSRRAIAVTWIVFILISADTFLTFTALQRYSERFHKIPAQTKFEAFLDKKYPDSFMKIVYPDMKFKN